MHRCNILKRVPNCALWLLRFPAAGENRLRACKYSFVVNVSCWSLALLCWFYIPCLSFLVLHSFVDALAQGVKPEQIIFTDVAIKNEHIRRSSLADLFLDT